MIVYLIYLSALEWPDEIRVFEHSGDELMSIFMYCVMHILDSWKFYRQSCVMYTVI